MLPGKERYVEWLYSPSADKFFIPNNHSVLHCESTLAAETEKGREHPLVDEEDRKVKSTPCLLAKRAESLIIKAVKALSRRTP